MWEVSPAKWSCPSTSPLAKQEVSTISMLASIMVVPVFVQDSAVVLDVTEVISFEVSCCRRQGAIHNAQDGILQIFSLAGILFLHMAAGHPASELSLRQGGYSPHVNQIDELNKIANSRV